MTKHQLITIPYSHYNEQARWALDRFGVDYQEAGYLPILHFLPVMIATLGRGAGKSDRVSTRFSTPVLITDTGRRICDSREIMRYASEKFSNSKNNLYPNPEVEKLQNHYHDKLGPATRKIVYYYLASAPEVTDELVKKTVSYPQWLISQLFKNVASKAIAEKLNVNATTAAHAVDVVRRELKQAGKTLQSKRYLTGNRFTAADISFACLASPALWIAQPDGHSTIPQLENPLPEVFASLIKELRETDAGKFILRMFRKER